MNGSVSLNAPVVAVTWKPKVPYWLVVPERVPFAFKLNPTGKGAEPCANDQVTCAVEGIAIAVNV